MASAAERRALSPWPKVPLSVLETSEGSHPCSQSSPLASSLMVAAHRSLSGGPGLCHHPCFGIIAIHEISFSKGIVSGVYKAALWHRIGQMAWSSLKSFLHPLEPLIGSIRNGWHVLPGLCCPLLSGSQRGTACVQNLPKFSRKQLFHFHPAALLQKGAKLQTRRTEPLLSSLSPVSMSGPELAQRSSSKIIPFHSCK